MKLDWVKCKGGVWCDLFRMNTEHPAFKEMEGIFILWIGQEKDRKILKIGYGNLGEMLINTKNDLAVQAFRHLGTPVTFAEIQEEYSIGILTYLIKKLSPQMSRAPKEKTHPIKVNLPW